jgi:phosphoglycolate phosphatase
MPVKISCTHGYPSDAWYQSRYFCYNATMIHGFIFDLDGTLVDTLGDIATGMNSFLQGRGLPVHPTEDYRRMVGKGLLHLISEAVPQAHRHEANSWYPDVLAIFKVMGAGSSIPYPGVSDTLGKLASLQVPMAVVSNKPDPVTAQVVAQLFPSIRFALVRGGLDGVPVKPHPAGAIEAAQAMGLKPGNCGFLGDSDVDMKTALAAGMVPLGAAWGFRTRVELEEAGAAMLLDGIQELLGLIGKQET